ncbi:hypothetical protein AZSI13_00420 [Azospira sp. I13]|nr:hypothetical protein AZSI13_00420 [Azospira sp. I13]
MKKVAATSKPSTTSRPNRACSTLLPEMPGGGALAAACCCPQARSGRTPVRAPRIRGERRARRSKWAGTKVSGNGKRLGKCPAEREKRPGWADLGKRPLW